MNNSSWLGQLNEILEILQKATPNHPVFRGGKFAIMTGEKPIHPVHPGYEGENQTLTQHLDALKAKGHIAGYEPVKGQYGGPENSFLIHRPNFEKIKELGEKFGQESVVLSNNGIHHLAYTNGELKGRARPHEAPKSTDPGYDPEKIGSGVIQHDTEPKDLYTVAKDLDRKKMIFTIPFDFGTSVPLKGKSPMQKSSGHELHLNFDMSQFVEPHSEDKKLGVLKAFRRNSLNKSLADYTPEQIQNVKKGHQKKEKGLASKAAERAVAAKNRMQETVGRLNSIKQQATDSFREKGKQLYPKGTGSEKWGE